jgi:hypothetical protein
MRQAPSDHPVLLSWHIQWQRSYAYRRIAMLVPQASSEEDAGMEESYSHKAVLPCSRIHYPMPVHTHIS